MVDMTPCAAFLVAAFALCVTPDPDMRFIVARSGGRGGPAAGVMAALGVACAMRTVFTGLAVRPVATSPK